MLEKNQVLIESRLVEAAYGRNVYKVKVEHGTTKENILKPEFWANTAYRLQEDDRIEVYADDKSFFLELMVLHVPEKTPSKPVNYAKVVLMREVLFNEAHAGNESLVLPKGYEIKFRGEKLKWSVLRSTDGSVIVEKQASEQDAVAEFNKQKSLLSAA